MNLRTFNRFSSNFRTYLFGQGPLDRLYGTILVVFTDNSEWLALGLTSFLLNKEHEVFDPVYLNACVRYDGTMCWRQKVTIGTLNTAENECGL